MPKRPTQQDDIPQALAALTLDNTIAETEWTSDTGVSNHMTGKQGMLTNIRNYSGSDSVLIGDGSSLPILGIGDSSIKQKNKSTFVYMNTVGDVTPFFYFQDATYRGPRPLCKHKRLG